MGKPGRGSDRKGSKSRTERMKRMLPWLAEDQVAVHGRRSRRAHDLKAKLVGHGFGPSKSQKRRRTARRSSLHFRS